MDPFQLPSQDPGKIGRLVPHGIFVDCDEFLEGLDGQVFREILDHSENSIVEGPVDLTGVLDVLERSEEHGEYEKKKTNTNRNNNKRESNEISGNGQ